MELHLTDIDLSKTITDYLQTKKTSEANHTFSGMIDPDIHIMADKNAVISLVMNLVENAEKYTPATTPIEIKLSRINNDVFLQVCDQGPEFLTTKREKFSRNFIVLATKKPEVPRVQD